jgi:hypothetical protein
LGSAHGQSLPGANMEYAVISRVIELRHEAARTRQSAEKLDSVADQQRLIHLAEELEKEAALLELQSRQ